VADVHGDTGLRAVCPVSHDRSRAAQLASEHAPALWRRLARGAHRYLLASLARQWSRQRSSEAHGSFLAGTPRASCPTRATPSVLSSHHDRYLSWLPTSVHRCDAGLQDALVTPLLLSALDPAQSLHSARSVLPDAASMRRGRPERQQPRHAHHSGSYQKSEVSLSKRRFIGKSELSIIGCYRQVDWAEIHCGMANTLNSLLCIPFSFLAPCSMQE
jgi:hypothetical protein